MTFAFTALMLAADDAPTPDLLAPNWGLAFWTIVVFTIVFLLLKSKAWPTITAALGEREEKIQASLDEAKRALAEAKQLQSDNAKARREAEQDAQRILREAREAAEKITAEQVNEARVKAQQVREQALADIENEKQSAIQALRAEVADLAIQAASKILDENMDAPRQRSLVDKFIDSLPSNTN
ncbi:MAG: F0F1 ATP synthase subunit B [Rhodothermales bacterium]